VRFSNVCNLRCRSCSPELSSSWFEDGKLIGYDPAQRVLSLEGTSYLEHLETFLPHVEEIAFVGGEPLLMKEHYHILRRLLESGRTDVRLRYHTNFTKLALGKEDALELWKEFRNVWVFASVDGFGPKGELIRKGMSWETIRANKRALDRSCPHARFTVFYTLSALNILHLPDFLRELHRLPEFRGTDLTINFLHEPKFLSPQIFPAAFKERVRARLEEFRKEAEGLPNLHTIQTALDFMSAESHEEELPRFLMMMRRMDEIRGENFLATFPELRPVLEEAPA
jgi:MoaA/NifB/PqqE/SkfB family radical SAM enzyme